jgi:hypothetical protein
MLASGTDFGRSKKVAIAMVTNRDGSSRWAWAYVWGASEGKRGASFSAQKIIQ